MQAPSKPYLDEFGHLFDEKRAEARLDEQLTAQQHGITLARQIVAIRHSPGFAEFEKAVRASRDNTLKRLVTSTAGNDWLRVLQGQAQAYESILAVVDQGQDRVQALEEGLKELQNQRAVLSAPRNQKARS